MEPSGSFFSGGVVIVIVSSRLCSSRTSSNCEFQHWIGPLLVKSWELLNKVGRFEEMIAMVEESMLAEVEDRKDAEE